MNEENVYKIKEIYTTNILFVLLDFLYGPKCSKLTAKVPHMLKMFQNAEPSIGVFSTNTTNSYSVIKTQSCWPYRLKDHSNKYLTVTFPQ